MGRQGCNRLYRSRMAARHVAVPWRAEGYRARPAHCCGPQAGAHRWPARHGALGSRRRVPVRAQQLRQSHAEREARGRADRNPAARPGGALFRAGRGQPQGATPERGAACSQFHAEPGMPGILHEIRPAADALRRADQPARDHRHRDQQAGRAHPVRSRRGTPPEAAVRHAVPPALRGSFHPCAYVGVVAGLVPAIHACCAKTWLPAPASLRSLRKLGCKPGRDGWGIGSETARPCVAATCPLVNPTGIGYAACAAVQAVENPRGLAASANQPKSREGALRSGGWPTGGRSLSDFVTTVSRFGAVAGLALALGLAPAHGQGAPASHPWLDPTLLAGAKAEGALTVYSSTNEQEGLPLFKIFEEATGIKVEYVRASDSVLTARMTIEFRANQKSFDIVQMTTITKLPPPMLPQYEPPEANNIIPEARDPGKRWFGVYANYNAPAYNTQRVKASDLPKSYEEFSRRKEWAGQVAIDGTDNEWL